MGDLTQWTRIDMMGERLAELPSVLLNRILWEVKRFKAAIRIQAATRGAKARYNSSIDGTTMFLFRPGMEDYLGDRERKSVRNRYFLRDISAPASWEGPRSWDWAWGYTNRYDPTRPRP